MSYMVIMIVDDPENCPAIIDAWVQLGVSGVTILPSSGMGRMKKAALLGDDLPLMPRLQDFLETREEEHRTLLSVVESEQIADKMVVAAQSITGNLDEPHTGVLFVIPVLKAFGLGRK